MKSRLIFIGISILAIFVIVIYLNKDNRYYEKDYYAQMQLNRSSNFKEIKAIYGEPNEVIVEKFSEYNGVSWYFADAIFNDFTACFQITESELNDRKRPESLWIYTDAFKFGKDELCVGSTRQQVNDAYSRCKKAKKVEVDCREFEDVFYDNYTHITYYYNENNIVEKIVFSYYRYD